MSDALPGTDPTTVQTPWLQANIVGKAPLGALYPLPHFGMEGLAAADAELKTVIIDATYLKGHRTASSLRVTKGASAA